ncbi:MAG: PRC-barrel domain containing protein [DPANN group archaeon]|nr:PRC-barrel domain containing protein [DPANN group archaeon]
MSKKRNSGDQDFEGTITSDDVLGKDVIDPDGAFLGIIEKLHIDPRTLEIVGITIDKGFLKKGLFIGRGYIQKITKFAVFLSIRPAYDVKGMAVFDTQGKKVGTVREVILVGQQNRIRSLIVQSRILRKHFIVPRDFIDTISRSVFLTCDKDVLERMQLELKA